MKKPVLFFVVFCIVQIVVSQDIQVTFPSGSLTFNGTLSLPSGNGPFPVVVFSHGSGPNDRDQTLPLNENAHACLLPGLYKDTVRNFKDLAQSFQQRGIAVLRYDKRSFTHKNLNLKALSPYDFIADIHAAVDYVKTRSEIDTACIMLLGHSQGGNFIPIVAKQRNDIHALISLGTGASGIDSIIATQYRSLYYKCLKDTLTGDSLYRQSLIDFAGIRNRTWNANTPYTGAYPKFWKDWMDITDSAVINYQNASQPTLLLHAMEDFNIPLEDANRYKNQVVRSNFEIYFMDGLNHYFTTSTIPKVADAVSDTIFNWLQKVKLNSSRSEQIARVDQVSIGYSNDQVILINTSGKTIKKVNVVDMNGKVLKSFNDLEGRMLYLEKQNFPRGMYVLVAQLEGQPFTKKIVIDY